MKSLAVVAVALSLAAGASATTGGTPRHYLFSFHLNNAKPDYVHAFPAIRVIGNARGDFSIGHRQIDRDGTVFWDLGLAGGSVALATRDHVFVRAWVVGGTFGTEKVTGGLARNVLLRLRIVNSTRFHCRKPAATLGLQDMPRVKGNSDAAQFHACGADVQWNGTAPKLRVLITPH